MGRVGPGRLDLDSGSGVRMQAALGALMAVVVVSGPVHRADHDYQLLGTFEPRIRVKRRAVDNVLGVVTVAEGR